MAMKKYKPRAVKARDVQQQVRLTPQEHAKLQRIARERETSVSALIRLTLREAGLL